VARLNLLEQTFQTIGGYLNEQARSASPVRSCSPRFRILKIS
jgi:hypothetical protein